MAADVTAALPTVPPATPTAAVPTQDRTPWLVVTVVLAGVLLLALASGAWWSSTQLTQRDAVIAGLDQHVGQLTEANLTFQRQVADLTTQRNAVVNQRDTLTAERDQLVIRRDTLTKERDGLTAQVAQLNQQVGDLQKQSADLQKQLTDSQAKAATLEQNLGDRDRQLSQAREEGSRQQTRAVSAENTGAVLAQVILIDDAIHTEYLVFLGHIDAMNKAYNNRNYIAGDAAYARATASARRLDDLFAKRKAALAQLR